MHRKQGLLVLGCVLFLFAGCGEKKEVFQQASEDLENSHYEDAIAGFEQSIANDAYTAEAYRGAGIAKMGMGSYEEAVKDFEQALNLKDAKAFQKDVLSYKATAEYKGGNYQEAGATCEQLSQLDDSQESSYLMGIVELKLDNYEGAKDAFAKAYEKDPSYNMAIEIYQAYKEVDMEADGTEFLDKALEMEPKEPEDYYKRGLIYYYTQDTENAKKELIEAINEEYTQAALLLGKVYLSDNDSANARAMYQQYIDAKGDTAQGYNGLALCDIAEGQYDSALQNIENGLADADTEETQELLFNEVVAYERKQDYSTAQAKVEEYLQMFPQDQEAQREAAFIKSRL